MKIFAKYFVSSFVTTAIGIVLAGFIGAYYMGGIAGAVRAIFLVSILSVLEVSISFDNAVVNATVLKKMSPIWQKRFITWGMLIAVFGMRLVFPLLIVAIAAQVSPLQALILAGGRPDEYARIMLSVHHEVSAFGGSFLMLVALKYFLDRTKVNHWIRIIEKPLVKMGKLEAIEVGIVLLCLYLVGQHVSPDEKLPFLLSGIWGILTYLLVEGIGVILSSPQEGQKMARNASIASFIYLEVLDASFSFDGVVGAFAITNNLFLIAIGLGVGAMFVRSLTIMLVEKQTLDELKYLENGAFYAVGSLAVIMFLNTQWEVPEVVTGLISAAFIGLSIWSSIRSRDKPMRLKR